MCATYVLRAERKILESVYGITLPGDFIGIDERITPFKMAPLIVLDHGVPILRPMQFSLIPSWSKEAKPKFATFNARIEDIETKPTWKEPFRRFHCIVPITDFIEPIYTGDYAGNMVTFQSEGLLHAAGIYNTWMNPTTGEVIDSFALIMTEGLSFVRTIGHERSPVFLNLEAAQTWLRSGGGEVKQMKPFLLSQLAQPELKVAVDRPMAKGWEKRIPKDL